MKKTWSILAVVMLIVAVVALSACKAWVNPGDKLGGGKEGEIADPVVTTDYDNALEDVKANTDLSELSSNTSESNATTVPATTGIVDISASGTYVFSGNYGGINIAKASLNLHFIFNGANIKNTNGAAIDGTVNKKTVLVITLKDGTTNTVENTGVDADGEGVNAIHVKGSLAFNGKGTLNVTANSKSAIKASKDVQIVNATLNLTAENHGITAASVVAANCTVNVTAAGKDGINAECDEAKAFATDDGYVALSNVNYTCNVEDDGIQANTVAYIDGGNYSITSRGKGIKVSEIEYTEKNESGEKVTKTVTDGYYVIAIASGTVTFTCNNDAIHANSGNVYVNGGTLNVSTNDDAIHADNLVGIKGGNVNVTKCYEGIEGSYVEISGGTVNIVASDDGINAASTDREVSSHIIISGGDVTVDAIGDGIDSNGSILISGGTVTVHGPTSGHDAGLDADKGIVVTGGTVFATSTLGMVETPSSNSTQYVVSYAHQSTIAAGSTVSLLDEDGNILISVKVLKKCQSVILSCSVLKKGSTYYIYGGETKMATFKISSVITTIGSQGGSFPGGGAPGGGFGPGGPGGR